MSDQDDRELREEIEYHLARRAELEAGSASDAKRRFGNPTLIQEEMRAMRIPQWLDEVRQDLGYAVRTFARTPAFTIASVVALALGIGSVTAVFSVVDPLLFRPLPFQDEERLVSLGMSAPIAPDEWLLGPDYIEWRGKQTAFASMTSSRGSRDCDLTEGDPMRLRCLLVESNYLAAFGVRPFIGRAIAPEEDQVNSAPVALMSYRLWQSRYGGSEQIIGRNIEIDSAMTRIVGVLPERFEAPGLDQVDLLVPQRLDVAKEGARQGMSILHVYARLKPGVTLGAARDSLEPLFQHAMEFVPPMFRKEVKMHLSSFREKQVRDYKTASLVLLAAVLGVLLAGCANAANLMLARGAAREREMAVRAAIGASRWRILRQTLTENLFLSGLAGVIGIALAYALLKTLRNLAPEGIPRLATAGLDWRVLSFAVGLSIVAGILAGLAPALRLPSAESLTGARTTGARRDWLRQILVSAQIAISLVLLLGSGLLLESLWRIQQIQLGVETSHVVVIDADPRRGSSHNPKSVHAFFVDLEQRLRRLPGVEFVAISDGVPPEKHSQIIFSRIVKEGQQENLSNGTGGMVSRRFVTGGYFPALRIPILRGRGFSEEDRRSADELVVLDETLARRLYPNEDPIGKRIKPTMEGAMATIVGVAGNVRNAGLFEAAQPEVYVLQRDAMRWDQHFTVELRTQADIRALAPLIRSEIHQIDPKVVVEMAPFERSIQQLAARPRFNAMLLGLFSFFALALAAIGLAGVVSYLVAQRTQELGVRMALGATPAGIRTLVLGQSLRWILAGAVAGLAGGVVAARWLKSLLYQVEPNDPAVLIGVTVVLVGVGIVAAYLPARRAANLDPMVALRHD